MAEEKQPDNTKTNKVGSSHPYGPLVSAALIPKFPTAINLYKHKVFTRSNFLGEHQEQPFLAVSRHSGLGGRPDLVLHSGMSKEDPLLASLKIPKLHPHELVLELPSLTGGSDKGDGEGEKIEFSHTYVFPHGVYTFSVPIDGIGKRESLEWKHVRGDLSMELTGHHSSWACLRNVEEGSSDTTVEKEKKMKDGKEIILAWADVPQSIHKEAVFRFFGTGASSIMGDYWRLAVLWSGLCLFEHYRRAGEGGGGGGGGG